MNSVYSFADMPQFGLTSTNSHWGYGAAGAYSPYFTPSSLGSCAAPTASQFNTPALGFSGTTPDQTSSQDAFGSSAVTSRKVSNLYDYYVWSVNEDVVHIIII